MKDKLKNYGLWVSFASLLLIILQNSGIKVVPEQYNLIVNAILSVLVGLGIISSPEKGNGYLDK